MTVADIRFAAIEGSVSAPAGFRAAGVACGIKKSNGLDLALIVSDRPASAAAVFTTNKAQAAPVLVSKACLQVSGGRARAIVINSGCANACTGPEGMQTAEVMADTAGRVAGAAASEALVASTGVIGVALDREAITRGIEAAFEELSSEGGPAAARAIMTTDPFPKEAAVEVTTPAGTFRVGGIAKGSGMIEPLMATMLGVVTTDAQVAPALLQRALSVVTDVTFNAISVDGECSTNDCVFALANGASGVVLGDRDLPLLVEALTRVCEPLAIGIVRGGEGATKLVTIEVRGGRTDAEAKQAARAVANSPLVKTAIHGADPNWGRILAAAGRSGAKVDAGRASIRIGGVAVFERGAPRPFDAVAVRTIFERPDIAIALDLGLGEGAARAWGTDLSAEYVRINADYTT